MADCILIIDDAEKDRETLMRLFRNAGYTPLAASSGQEGLRFALKHHPDLITLDVLMPGLNGFQVCEQLKQNPRTSAIPVVLFTVCRQVVDIVRGLEAGADGFVLKQADQEELLRRIEAILADRRLDKRKAASRWKELKGLDTLVMTQNRQQILELLSTTFNQILHQHLRGVLGAEVTLVILQRVVRQVAQTHDIFRVKNSKKPALAFNSEAIAQLPVKQIVAGFRALIAELFALLTKLAGRILVEQLKTAMEEEWLNAQE